MIVESVLDLFVSAIEIIFGWINLPHLEDTYMKNN